jgi:hypothetical protein
MGYWNAPHTRSRERLAVRVGARMCRGLRTLIGPWGRSGPGTVALPDGKVLIVGGYTYNGVGCLRCEDM